MVGLLVSRIRTAYRTYKYSEQLSLLGREKKIKWQFDCPLDGGLYGFSSRNPSIDRLKGRYDVSQGKSTAETWYPGSMVLGLVRSSREVVYEEAWNTIFKTKHST
jgi:hypothetical protein